MTTRPRFLLLAALAFAGCSTSADSDPKDADTGADTADPSETAHDTGERDTDTASPSDSDRGAADASPITFTEIIVGESSFVDESTACGELDWATCQQTLSTRLANTQSELDALYASDLPGQSAPTLDFSGVQAVLAFIPFRGSGGNLLSGERVEADGTTLRVHASHTLSETAPDILTRPFLVLTVPAGGYTQVEGALTSSTP